VSDNLHITNAEFAQHVWPRFVEESNAIWPTVKIELGKRRRERDRLRREMETPEERGTRFK